MIITSSCSQFLTSLLQNLSNNFRIKDLGALHYFLGIQTLTDSDGTFLTQTKYAQSILMLADMQDCSAASTPLPTQVDELPGHDKPFQDVSLYRQLAGKLQYLTHTRPDIQYAVNLVCQRMHNPSEADFSLLKRILRYIKGTIYMGLYLTRHSTSTLIAFSDSDYAGCASTRRSTSGYCVFLGHNLISWSSKKQRTVSRSSTEAEYRALAEAAAELTWYTTLLREIGLGSHEVPLLCCDNLSATYLSVNPVFHNRSKHIEVDYHFVREKVADGCLIIKHVPAKEQLADILTKPLGVAPFTYLRSKLCVGNIREYFLANTVRENSTVPKH